MLEGGRRWLVARGVLGWLYSGASGGVLWQKRAAVGQQRHGSKHQQNEEKERKKSLAFWCGYFLFVTWLIMKQRYLAAN